MRIKKIVFWLCVLLFCSNSPFIFARGDSIRPVTPDASPEAVELLQYIYSISGNRVIYALF